MSAGELINPRVHAQERQHLVDFGGRVGKIIGHVTSPFDTKGNDVTLAAISRPRRATGQGVPGSQHAPTSERPRPIPVRGLASNYPSECPTCTTLATGPLPPSRKGSGPRLMSPVNSLSGHDRSVRARPPSDRGTSPCPSRGPSQSSLERRRGQLSYDRRAGARLRGVACRGAPSRGRDLGVDETPVTVPQPLRLGPRSPNPLRRCSPCRDADLDAVIVKTIRENVHLANRWSTWATSHAPGGGPGGNTHRSRGHIDTG